MTSLVLSSLLLICPTALTQADAATEQTDAVKAVSITLDELITAMPAASPCRVRIARGDSALNVILVQREGVESKERQFDCGPAWVVWLSGDPPKIDPGLHRLPFSRLFVREIADRVGASPSAARVSDAGRLERVVVPFAGDVAPSEADAASCGPILTPIDADDRTVDAVVWWPLARVAQAHARAVEGLAIARQLEVQREAAELRPPDDPLREQLLAPLQQRAARWLDERVDVPPQIGNAAIAWIELMDARQALLRANRRIEAADEVVRDLLRALERSRLPQLTARVHERLPVESSGFVSLCDSPCWIFDAGEVAAASQRLTNEQHAMCGEILAEVSRLAPCNAQLVDALRERLRLLVGQLPNGVRMNDGMRSTLRQRVDELCALDELAGDPILTRDYAATIALQVWTEAWRASDERSAGAATARNRWREQLLGLVGQQLSRSRDYATAIGEELRGAVLDEVSRLLQREFADSGNYLTAFAGDAAAYAQIESQWRTIVSERDQDEFARLVTVTPHDLPPDASPEQIAHDAGLARRDTVRLASQYVFADLMQALYMALTESEGESAYPKPFPTRYASFRASGDRILWRIGID